MEPTKEISPEIREQIEAKAKEFKEKTVHGEIVNDEELRAVAGGMEFDPNRAICGWTYTDLHALLCWVYESYHDPSERYDYAKEITVDVAYSYIPSIQWEHYKSNSYPAFIDLPMWNIWNGLGL